MNGSSAGNAALIGPVEDGRMETSRRPADDLLEVARVLLLLQGSILVATTIEALIWGFVFAGAAGTPVFMSGAAAATILVARVRLRADHRWTRRLVYAVEGLTLAVLAIDTILAIVLAGALPPAVALLTRLVLPMSVIVLLRRSARATAAPIRSSSVAALEVAS
jgi:hypothetical protein